METHPQYLTDLYPEEGRRDWAKGEAKLRRLLKEHPENEPMILHYLAINLSMQDKDDECIEVCHRLLQMNLEKQDVSENLFTIARSYEHKKDFEKAIEFYNKAISHAPDDEESITSLADIYKEKKDWDNALRTYDLLHDIDDDSAKETELNGKGRVYYEKGDWDTAMDYFRQGAEQFPKQACFYAGAAAIYVKKKEWDAAVEWYGKGLEWYGKAEGMDPQVADMHYNLGVCYQRKDDFYRAMHHYTEALKIERDFPEVYANLAGLALQHEGDIQKTIEMLKKAVESTPDEKKRMNLYFALNRVYKLIADYDNADDYAEKWMRSLGFDVKYKDDEDGEDN